jgi:hypothetical protein
LIAGSLLNDLDTGNFAQSTGTGLENGLLVIYD